MTYYFRQHLKSQHSKSAKSAKAHKVGDATNAVEANREASDVEEILSDEEDPPNVNTQQNESAESSKNIGDGCDGSDQGLDDQPDDLLDDSLDEGLDKQRDNGLSNEENIDMVPLPINFKTERTEENQGEEINLGEIDLTKKHTYKRKIAHNTTALRKKLRWNRK